MKRFTTIFLFLFCTCLLAGCSCKHAWEEATCTAPQTCSLCKETTGEPLGHSWNDATCDAPKTCSRCNLTEGTALGHQWSALTCEETYVCAICGVASNVVGPHVDIRNITQDPSNNLLVQCKCGHEEILSIEELMLHLMQGKWSLRAVQKENSLFLPDPKANWEEGTWLEIPSAEEPVAYQVGTSAQGEEFAFQVDLLDFQLTNAALYANGPQLAVLMCNGRTEYGKDVHTDVPMILVFGDRGYAKEPMTDDEFINAALKGTVTSLWRHSDGAMYIYGYDIG